MYLKNTLCQLTVIGLMVALISGCQSGPSKKMVRSDIPLTTIPTGTFVEPPAEYRMVFQPILFDYDKSSIRTDMQPALRKIAQWLNIHTKVRLRIEGHCDERGTEEYNLGLGERRALSVRRFIIDQGIDPTRTTTVSYGEERPANSDHNEIAWAENRRVEFKLAQ